MRLQDVISHMDLAVFPEVALLLFAGAFAAVALRTRGRGEELQALSGIPLDDPREVKRD